MKDYIRLLGAVKAAIAARESALKAYNHAAGMLSSKQERLEKLRSGAAKEEKVSALQKEVAEAEEQVTLTKAEYETIVTRVDSEMARFQTEKLHDFKAYCVNFIKLQIEYSERVQASWRELLHIRYKMRGAISSLHALGCRRAFNRWRHVGMSRDEIGRAHV